jgi:hypothetical protein
MLLALPNWQFDVGPSWASARLLFRVARQRPDNQPPNTFADL